jgi:hypothetical protein
MTVKHIVPTMTETGVYRAPNIPREVIQSYYSVAKINSYQGNSTASGSGTYLGNGLFLTNNHVVDGGSAYDVVLKDKSRYRADLLYATPDPDLALVRTRNLDSIIKPVEVSPVQVQSGDIVFPSGFDRGNLDWHTIWPAKVQKFYENGSWEAYGIGLRKGSIAGNSGGPTFDSKGRLISPLWGTSGSDNLSGNGSTLACCWGRTRWFLRPVRSLILAAIRARRPIYQPIIINIDGNKFPIQPQQQPEYLAPQGYMFEGKLIPLRTNTKTAERKPTYDDTGWKPPKIVPLNSGIQLPTQYGYCPPPQNYGGGSPYSSPYGQQGPQRPTLPNDPYNIPKYVPDEPQEPKELELDYEELAEALIPKMEEKGTFKGKDGDDAATKPLINSVNMLSSRMDKLERDVQTLRDTNAKTNQNISSITTILEGNTQILQQLKGKVQEDDNRIKDAEDKATKAEKGEKFAKNLIMYYTGIGCTACKETDKKVAELKTNGYPIVVTRLSPKNAELQGVPRIHVPYSNENVEGTLDCNFYLASIVW